VQGYIIAKHNPSVDERTETFIACEPSVAALRRTCMKLMEVRVEGQLIHEPPGQLVLGLGTSNSRMLGQFMNELH
jgi:hypothetical protein